MAHSTPNPFLLFTTLLVVSTLSTLAQNTGNITVGNSITATENSNPWRSRSGDFAFGFQQLPDNQNFYVLSIWFDRIPAQTIVWYDTRINSVPRGSTVQLDATQGLVIRDPRGNLLNRTQGLADQVAYGFMNDTGNFVLFRSDSTVLWESFRNPADTILPTQTLEIDETLISRKTPTNFSQGRFYAWMNTAGNFVFNTKSVPSNSDYDGEYYTSQTSDPNASTSGYRVVFNERAFLFILRRNGQQERLSLRSNPPPSENYYRATLDFDGVFTLYYHPKSFGSNPQWTPAQSWPSNICSNILGEKGSGACGYNSGQKCKIGPVTIGGWQN